MPRFQTLKDLNISFKPHPVTGDLTTLKDEAAIKQAILNLLLTEPGERVFNSQLGSGIRSLLFEPLDYGTAAQVNNRITFTLNKYEPRINILQIETTPNYEDNGFEVDLTFEYVGRQDEPITIALFLERTR